MTTEQIKTEKVYHGRCIGLLITMNVNSDYLHLPKIKQEFEDAKAEYLRLTNAKVVDAELHVMD